MVYLVYLVYMVQISISECSIPSVRFRVIDSEWSIPSDRFRVFDSKFVLFMEYLVHLVYMVYIVYMAYMVCMRSAAEAVAYKLPGRPQMHAFTLQLARPLWSATGDSKPPNLQDWSLPSFFRGSSPALKGATGRHRPPQAARLPSLESMKST